MRIIKEDVLIDNIKKIQKTNDMILVVKDNAYGFGICYMIHLAKQLNVNKFAVKSISEGIFVKSIYKDSSVLVLGKIKKEDIEDVKKYDLIPTINDYDDYILFKEQKLSSHLAIDTGMNRFGMKSGFLAIINDSIVKAVYTHLYDSETKNKIQFIEQLSKNYLKPFHIGGSVAYGKTKGTIRVGRMVYENALYFYGQIVNIKEIDKKETVGYDGLYQATGKKRIGVCNVGYADGLSLFYHGRVRIQDRFYSCVGKCCMDQCFILIDDQVDLWDEVEFFGKEINEDEFIKNNQMSKYEMFLRINRQNTGLYP